MTDRPILFSAPMVRALLDGRKTQTRRVIKPQPPAWVSNGRVAPHLEFSPILLTGRYPDNRQATTFQASPFLSGDRLWVRETLRANSNDQGARWYSYAADGADVWPLTEWYKTRDTIVSIHMPRWASRITLLVTEVRVQRLQDISEEDAVAEGCIPDDGSLNPNHIGPARSIFEQLWDSLNAERAGGAYAWDTNPWVTATTFKVVKGNIDQATP